MDLVGRPRSTWRDSAIATLIPVTQYRAQWRSICDSAQPAVRSPLLCCAPCRRTLCGPAPCNSDLSAGKWSGCGHRTASACASSALQAVDIELLQPVQAAAHPLRPPAYAYICLIRPNPPRAAPCCAYAASRCSDWARGS
eukprot:366433-Chlamydomonas_euryale.AAC.11